MNSSLQYFPFWKMALFLEGLVVLLAWTWTVDATLKTSETSIWLCQYIPLISWCL